MRDRTGFSMSAAKSFAAEQQTILLRLILVRDLRKKALLVTVVLYLLCANLDFKEIIYRWASREPRSIVITRCRLQLGHSMAFHTLPLAAHL